jgi:hypothetical protein
LYFFFFSTFNWVCSSTHDSDFFILYFTNRLKGEYDDLEDYIDALDIFNSKKIFKMAGETFKKKV